MSFEGSLESMKRQIFRTYPQITFSVESESRTQRKISGFPFLHFRSYRETADIFVGAGLAPARGQAGQA